MADDKTKSGGQDRTRIDVNEEYELRDWAKKFGVTPDELKAAVDAVGTPARKRSRFAHEPRLRGIESSLPPAGTPFSDSRREVSTQPRPEAGIRL